MEERTWEFANIDIDHVLELIDEASVSRPVALVLAARDINAAKVHDFLNPDLANISDPYLLPGTRRAAERLWQAVDKEELIVIHGDYDTDGITASALLASILRKNGARVECYLPHRIDDGYGLTAESIARAAKEGCALLLTVDCGITSHEAAAAAKSCGLDLIITDHHTPDLEKLNALAVVDPKLPGAPPETQELAGVGVAYKVAQAFLKMGREYGYDCDESELQQCLDLVALGTVADIVPLLHENRILVHAGLQILASQHRPGIHALCGIAGVNESLQTSDITYRLAPRINATGRMGDPTDGLQLLEAESIVEANRLARSLDELNKKRQLIEEDVVRNAEEQIKRRYNLDSARSIVVWNDGWHQGVVGIVASRLTRRYHRPSIVLTRDNNGQFTGSARSIRKLNLITVLDECAGTLSRFGGHTMAAGLSLNEDKLEEFSEQFDAAVQKALGIESMKPLLNICGEVRLDELDEVFFQELQMLEPFGHGNPEPVFYSRHVSADKLLPAGSSHTRGTMRDESGMHMQFIAFGRPPESFPPAPWDIVYSPHINRYNGYEIPQLRILDVVSSR